MNRRSFFSRLAAVAVAAVAAPVILRDTVLADIPRITTMKGIYEQLLEAPPLTCPTPLQIDELFKSLYALAEARRRNP